MRSKKSSTTVMVVFVMFIFLLIVICAVIFYKKGTGGDDVKPQKEYTFFLSCFDGDKEIEATYLIRQSGTTLQDGKTNPKTLEKYSTPLNGTYEIIMFKDGYYPKSQTFDLYSDIDVKFNLEKMAKPEMSISDEKITINFSEGVIYEPVLVFSWNGDIQDVYVNLTLYGMESIFYEVPDRFRYTGDKAYIFNKNLNESVELNYTVKGNDGLLKVYLIDYAFDNNYIQSYGNFGINDTIVEKFI